MTLIVIIKNLTVDRLSYVLCGSIPEHRVGILRIIERNICQIRLGDPPDHQIILIDYCESLSVLFLHKSHRLEDSGLRSDRVRGGQIHFVKPHLSRLEKHGLFKSESVQQILGLLVDLAQNTGNRVISLCFLVFRVSDCRCN